MRSVGWTLIHSDCCTSENGTFGNTEKLTCQEELQVKIKAEIESCFYKQKCQRLPADQQVGRKAKLDSPSQPSEGTNFTDTWILDF